MSKRISGPRVGPDSDADFGMLLGSAYQGFVIELNAHLADAGFSGVSASYGYVFRALLAGDLTATKLGAKLGITTQGAAKLVDDMERTGYIEKHADPGDARVKLLRLSEQGRRAVAEARRFHQAFEDRLASRHGATQVAELRRLLVAMADEAFEDGERSFRQL
jgi:DNA-binding MarR family transcriptional regulator